MTSEGHWAALNLSRIEWRKLWIVQPAGVIGFSHLLRAPLAELALHTFEEVYRGNAKVWLWVSLMRVAAQSAAPTKSIYLSLEIVFSGR